MLAELAARKTDQDILREKLIALKKKGSLTPMTLDVYLKWKQERVDKMKAEAEATREERIKNNLLTGREIIEQQQGGAEAAIDAGASAGDDEIARLLKARKEADEEAERKAAEEAAENLARAKNLGDLYNIEMLPDDVDDLAEIEEEDDFAPPEGWTPDAVAPGAQAEDVADETAGAADQSVINEKRARREAELKSLEEEGITLVQKTTTKDKEAELFKPAVEIPDEALGDGEMDPKKLGELIAAKRAAEEAARKKELEDLAEEKVRKEAAKAAKKAEREAARAAKKKKKKEAKMRKNKSLPSAAIGKVDLEETGASLKRMCTGVLASRPTARDIKIINYSMGMGGRELIKDCYIELTIVSGGTV